MGPASPRPGSRSAVTRPPAPSQRTPSQAQQEPPRPDHAARRRRSPPAVRFPAKARSARRSSGWQAAAAAPAGKRSADRARKSMGRGRRQHFAMDSA
uniref:Uncharacterized protein n=1 Tax=Triticum urartu TaxID=4572 RepID=A0A8R7PFD2_TRIUA